MKPAGGLLALLLCACTSVPVQTTRPSVAAPAAWQMTTDATEDTGSAAAFWASFGSPSLQALQQQAAAANPDLQIALLHLSLAADQQRLAAAQQQPAVSLVAGPVDSTAVAVSRQHSVATYRLGLDASYEIDFWGRIKNLVASADASAAASRFDVETAAISLQGAVAQQLFDLGEADDTIGLLQQRAHLATERQRLETARAQAGRVDRQTLDAAQRGIDQLAAEISDWQRQRQQHEWQLALLLGQLPENFTVAVGSPRQGLQPPVVPAGLPSSLLQRRPDVQAASARLQAAEANCGVVRAEAFPQIRLTAELGLATDLLRPARLMPLLGLGPDLSWPLLDGGARRARLDASQREAEIAAIEYRKTALAAFADVERALQWRQALGEQQQQLLKLQQQHQQDQQRLAALLQAGRNSRLDLIAAEDAGLQISQQLLHNDREQLDGLLALHAALGGGWHAADAPTALSQLDRTLP